MRRLIILGVLALLLPPAAFAQINATVTGTVSDASAALIPGVEVTATNVNTGIEQISLTNETGNYNFVSLQPGTYKISATLSGFQTQTFEGVQLSQAQQVRLNFTLQVAGLSNTVEVTVAADTALATTTSSVGSVLPTQEIQTLPMASRDVYNLLNTIPGVVGGTNFGGTGNRQLNLSRDGLSVNDTRFNAAGGQNGPFVSPDLVEEVQVVIGNVDPSVGRGSGQVSLQTRSGSNQFHGALFDYNTNSALGANDFFSNQQGRKPDYSNRNQFGGRLGGPIIRNKAFFFVLIDETRYIKRENFVANVLTPEARRGIFRYINGQQNGNALSASKSVDQNGNILNPANLRQFCLFGDNGCGVPGIAGANDPFRTAPMDNAYWRQFLAAMPLPNDYTKGDGLNTAGYKWTRRYEGCCAGNGSGPSVDRDQLNLRFDYQINSKNTVTFTTSREHEWSDSAGLLSDWPIGYNAKTYYFPGLYTTAWTSTISTTLLNTFRFGQKVTGNHLREAFSVGCCSSRERDPATWNDRTPEAQKVYDLFPKSNGYPFYPIPSGFMFGVANQNGGVGNLKHAFGGNRSNYNYTRQFSDSVSWVKGSHSFTFGFESVKNWSGPSWALQTEQIPTVQFGQGNFPVSNITSTRFPGLNSTDATNATALLNDLAGSVGGITFGRVIHTPTQTTWDDILTDPRLLRHATQQDYSGFMKDTWNASKNLTLNLGVRYDKFGVMYDQKGMMATIVGGENGLFNYRNNGTLTRSQLVGKNSPNPNVLLYPNDWKDFGPSVGFSYQIPWFSKTTVIRGGYGVNYASPLVTRDIDNTFGSSPGSVDLYGNGGSTGGKPFSPTTYATMNQVQLPLPAKTQPGNVVVPVTDKSTGTNVFGDDRRTPYIQSFNLSVQRDLAPGLNLTVAYVGNKGTRLGDNYQINEPEISSNGFLGAFNTTLAGGNAALFDRLLMGLNVPGVGVVNGTTLTGSQAMRRWSSTRTFVANGSVSQLANFLSTTNAITGVSGGLLTNGGLRQDFITASPQFTEAVIWKTTQNSTYHSVQTSLTQRFARGMSGQITYTLSKALGDSISGEAASAATSTLDPNNRRLNKGRLSFDRRHVIQGHGTWDLPLGNGKALLAGIPAWANHIVGGWQLSSVVSWLSGNPLTITSPVKTVGTVSNTSVPDIVGEFPKNLGKVTVGDAYVSYFPGLSSVLAPTAGLYGADPNNLASFSTNRNIVDASGRVLLTNPQAGKVGTLGTRWIEGPSAMQFDLSLAKKVAIRENVSFTFRADAVNVLNKPVWGDPNVNINSVDFGQITTATGNRSITLSARIDF
jgi:hypothetical protein